MSRTLRRRSAGADGSLAEEAFGGVEAAVHLLDGVEGLAELSDGHRRRRVADPCVNVGHLHLDRRQPEIHR